MGWLLSFWAHVECAGAQDLKGRGPTSRVMDSGKLFLWWALFSLLALPCAVGLGFFFGGKDRDRQNQRLQEMAEHLSLKPEPGGRMFRGTLDSRNVELYPAVNNNRGRGGGMSLAVGVRVFLSPEFGHRGYARCAQAPSDPKSFEEAFAKARMGLEGLTADHKAALLRFVRDHGNLFLEADKAPACLEFTARTSDEVQLRSALEQMCQLGELLEQ